MLTFVRNQYNPDRYSIPTKFQADWNLQVDKLFKDKGVLASLETIFSLDTTVTSLKNLAWDLISLTITENNPDWNPSYVTKTLENSIDDDKVQILCGLSVLELCLVIAMKHQTEIYDNDPFNFEMIFNRFQKFANASTTMQGMVEGNLVLKAFEHIKALELIVPVSNLATARQQKMFQMHRFLLMPSQVKNAVNKYQNLPVDVSQWAMSSIA
uniref:Origin recognition complex subunit 4 n=1 Tax=Culicoides sonorensis TaxID=179676 RepID=A0A336N2F7_CULSO